MSHQAPDDSGRGLRSLNAPWRIEYIRGIDKPNASGKPAEHFLCDAFAGSGIGRGLNLSFASWRKTSCCQYRPMDSEESSTRDSSIAWGPRLACRPSRLAPPYSSLV